MLLITYVSNNLCSNDDMDLRATILGLLSWKAASGYDLKRTLAESEVFYWSGNNNQVYKSLLELQHEGLVTVQVVLQESLPAKKIYTITGQGLAELRRSLLQAPQPLELHKNFLVQLAWAQPLTDDEVLRLLEAYVEEIANRLWMAEALAAREEGAPNRSPREQYLWQRISENLVAAYRTELDWARQTIQGLMQGKYSQEQTR